MNKILADIVALLSTAWPLPDLKDKAAVKAWLAANSGPLVDLVYDAGGLGAVKAALEAAPEAPDGYAAGELEANGAILAWLIAHKQQILDLIALIVAVVPK